MRDFLKHTDRVVHIVVDKATIHPRTRIRLACIQLVDGKEQPVYMHEHTLYPNKKAPVIGKECADLLEEIYSGKFEL